MGYVSYTDEQKVLGVAALAVWGARPAARLLAQEWGEESEALSHHTLIAWRDAGIQASVKATEEISQVARQRKERWHAEIDARREATFEAYDVAVEKRNFLGMQQASTAIGIQLDKLVPPAKSGVPMIGSADTVNMMLMAPATEERLEEASALPSVIEGESREVPSDV